MFALEVEYLTGRAVATARHNRDLAEWPPHPGRLFSALVAACHEGDLTSEQRAAGQEALRWLECLSPPALAVGSAGLRDVPPVFVPVNDSESPEAKRDGSFSAGQTAAGIAVLPERRPRQARTFPTVIPEKPVVHFIWQDADAEGLARHRSILEMIASHLTYLGHSSSLVRAAICDTPPEPTFVPADGGPYVFRVTSYGRLAELERDYARRAPVSPGAYRAYREVGERSPPPLVTAESVFGDLIVCQIDGPDLPLSGTLRMTSAVRDAMLTQVNGVDPRVRTLVSGHTDTGGVSEDDHVAYIPLANISHRYADGIIKGFALVLPRRLGRFSEERRAILRALVGVEGIGFGGNGYWQVEPHTTGEGPKSLEAGPYLGAARQWASVTPLLCDRFPKDKDGQRIEDIIRGSCRRVVGIEPVFIEVGKISRHRGVPPSHAFFRTREPGAVPRHRVHVYLEFDRPVRGPVLIGAGRYFGLGLFRVWQGEGVR